MAYVDDRGNDTACNRLALNPVDGGLVDLDDINRKIADHAKRGIARSEIIHQNFCPVLPEL